MRNTKGKVDLIPVLNSLGVSINDNCETYSKQPAAYYADRMDNFYLIDTINTIKAREIRAKALLLKNALRILYRKRFNATMRRVRVLQRFGRWILLKRSRRLQRQRRDSNSIASGGGISHADAASSESSSRRGSEQSASTVSKSQISQQESSSITSRNKNRFRTSSTGGESVDSKGTGGDDEADDNRSQGSNTSALSIKGIQISSQRSSNASISKGNKPDSSAIYANSSVPVSGVLKRESSMGSLKSQQPDFDDSDDDDKEIRNMKNPSKETAAKGSAISNNISKAKEKRTRFESDEDVSLDSRSILSKNPQNISPLESTHSVNSVNSDD